MDPNGAVRGLVTTARLPGRRGGPSGPWTSLPSLWEGWPTGWGRSCNRWSLRGVLRPSLTPGGGPTPAARHSPALDGASILGRQGGAVGVSTTLGVARGPEPSVRPSGRSEYGPAPNGASRALAAGPGHPQKAAKVPEGRSPRERPRGPRHQSARPSGRGLARAGTPAASPRARPPPGRHCGRNGLRAEAGRAGPGGGSGRVAMAAGRA